MNAREHLKNLAADYGSREQYDAVSAIDALMMEIASCIIYSVERNNNGPVNARLNAIEKRLIALGYSPEDKNG